jgi:hypothetical protein
VQGSIARDGWGTGAWAGQLFYGPTLPFALALTAGAGFDRRGGSGAVVGALGLSIYLPVIRRFAIGVTPAGVALRCDTRFETCDATLVATLGELLIRLPHSAWLGLQGPRWSWNERALRGPIAALALGWSHEMTPPEGRAGPNAVTTWNPPAPEEVSGYRMGSTSWLFFLAATAASTSQNQWVGGGVELRRDRDRWDRRAGWAPAVSLAAATGTTDGTRGGTLSLAPILRFYLVPNRIWLGATPVALRVGALDRQSYGVDVAGVAALGLIVGRLELTVESPPLSYVSRDRWHAIPVPMRLGLLFD